MPISKNNIRIIIRDYIKERVIKKKRRVSSLSSINLIKMSTLK